MYRVEQRKATSTPANNVEATLSSATSRTIFHKVECFFKKVERCFDIVAFLATLSNKVSSFRQSRNNEHIQFVSILSKGRNFTNIMFDIVAKPATKSNVASTLLLVP